MYGHHYDVPTLAQMSFQLSAAFGKGVTVVEFHDRKCSRSVKTLWVVTQAQLSHRHTTPSGKGPPFSVSAEKWVSPVYVPEDTLFFAASRRPHITIA